MLNSKKKFLNIVWLTLKTTRSLDATFKIRKNIVLLQTVLLIFLYNSINNLLPLEIFHINYKKAEKTENTIRLILIQS